MSDTWLGVMIGALFAFVIAATLFAVNRTEYFYVVLAETNGYCRVALAAPGAPDPRVTRPLPCSEAKETANALNVILSGKVAIQ